jgi:putative CocE/NonD family hydrolase
MKLRFFFIAFLVSVSLNAQPIVRPSAFDKDSLPLASEMMRIAYRLLAKYEDAATYEDIDKKFRLELVVQAYEASLKSLYLLRKQIPDNGSKESDGVGFQFEAYAKTQLKASLEKSSFQKAFSLVFPALFSKLSFSAAVQASSYYSQDIISFKKQVIELISVKSDTISEDDAFALCRNYLAFTVYSNSQEAAQAFIKEYEQKRYVISEPQLIKMRDGAGLEVNVVRLRESQKPLPVVMLFNIYNSENDVNAAKQIAEHGYVGVVVNTRGKGLSKQQIQPFEYDASDAYDAIDWLSKQKWCNGKVGMYGGSYLGFSQWAAAKKIHPALKTIIPQVSVSPGIDYPAYNHVYMGYMLQWLHFVSNTKETDYAEFSNPVYWANLYNSWYRSGQSFRSLDVLEGRPNTLFQRWLDHPSYDAYWQKMVPFQQQFAEINIPILSMTGYFDDDQVGALYYHREHAKYAPNAEHYLVIGPYDHGGAQGYLTQTVRGYTIDSSAFISIEKLEFDWFDYILKGAYKPDLLSNKINYQVMGSNAWKHVAKESDMSNDTMYFNFSNIRVGAHYKLLNHPAKAPMEVVQEVDLNQRKDTMISAEPIDINRLPEMDESVTFISDPISDGMEITGGLMGDLAISINKKDVDISLYAYQIQPDGQYFQLSYYIGRASYAKSDFERQLLTPGKEEIVPVHRSYVTSRKLEKGSRLLLIAGVNRDPFWEVNYGSGKAVCDETIEDAGEPLQIRWLSSSRLGMPVFRYSPVQK